MTNSQTVSLGKENYMHNYSQFLISIKSGKGVVLKDEDGKEYLDFVAGIAVNALGYGDEDERNALLEVLDEGVLHTSNLYYNRRAVEAAAMLNHLAGSRQVFFCNSGAEANEAAIKLARKRGSAKGKSRIISFRHSFHGRTYGAVTLTGQDKYHKGFAPMLPDVLYADFNDLDSVKALVDDSVTAIVCEPLQGEGGIIPADRGFIEGLRSLCDRYDALLIFDEVQCGLGRTGKPFCFQHYGVTPDVLTLAKAIGGGLPMGATLAFDRAVDVFSPGDHAATFGGNVASAALALVVLSKLEMLSENVARNGEHLHKRLEAIVKRHPDKAKEARGLGYMQGIDLTVNVSSVVSKCMEKGLLVCSAGYSVLRLVPPLVATVDDIDRACEIIDQVLGEM